MWNPIETIPKDGTQVDLLNIVGERTTDVYFDGGCFFQDTPKHLLGQRGVPNSSSVTLQNKTHWMLSPLLPEPPKKREPRDIYLHEIDGVIVGVLKTSEIGNLTTKDNLVKFREVMEDDS